jgi:hypothetical protein
MAACGLPIAAERPELHGLLWTWPSPTGPAVLPLPCPVNDCLSSVEVGFSAWLRGCCTLSRRCRVPPLFRPPASATKQLMRMTSRSWWRMLVDGEARWWRSLGPGFLSMGWEKSLLAWLTLTWCHRRVAPFLVGGHRGNSLSTVLYVPGQP